VICEQKYIEKRAGKYKREMLKKEEEQLN